MALVIVAVLLCTAIPAMGGMLARHRLVTAQIELVAALQHARGAAIIGRRRMLFCPSANGAQCTDDTHWENGWAIGRYRSTNADQLEGAPSQVHGGYRQLIITSTAGRKRIRFQPDGTTGGSNVTFVLCRPEHAEGALAVTVSNMGRVAGKVPGDDEASRCAAGG
ncbi:hypothetical protein HY57_08420 [Dyella japonica A8]|uniref:Type II secretion system protein H n=2 Tax=Dyella japonica TaxID=231455 RepID=A0A075JYW6_9GAMM|nr:hypothetical protein HY57_08420 [Dyella japonica A8]